MTILLRRRAKAAEYHSQALAAAALAIASPLDEVRKKHEVAAARWRVLAALNDHPAPISDRQP